MTLCAASGRLAVDGAALARFAQERAESAAYPDHGMVAAQSLRNRFAGLVTRVVRDTVVLADVTPDMPAYASEVFGPAAPVLKFATPDEAATLGAQSEYGLSLGILTRDVMRGLDLARRIPTGIVHINEQTVDDEPNVPFGGVLASGTGARFGGTANLDAFTETRWVTIRADIAPYPF
jgi:benzaldehyde dehydrogenase (NAD)